MKLTAVKLDDDELASLDGHCRPDVQRVVNRAVARLDTIANRPEMAPADAALLADVRSEAAEYGRLVWHFTRARICPVCDKRAGYYVFKSGPRRGKSDTARPLSFGAVEFAWRLVVVKGHLVVGACAECVDRVLPDLVDGLRVVHAELPPRLRDPDAPVLRRYELRRCPKCQWEGHEGEMGRVPTLLGDGTYPGKCPSCGFTQMPLSFREKFEYLDGFVVTDEVPVNA